MNRTDRLYAIREELRRAGPRGRTAEQLATAFEMSVRTVKRDISALQQAGFPVWARTGRIGGYVVDRAATLPPVNFTAAEASAIAAAIAAHRGQPFDQLARAALVKVLAVMDPQARQHVDALTERIWINHTTEPASPRRRTAVERALQERKVLSLHYRNQYGETSARRVDPQLLAFRDGQWFLVAHCRSRDAIRWFRLDGIERATLTTQRATDVPVEDLGTPPPTASSVRAAL
ncbi:helix-turn-helix transcriptional regulator [Kribbella italica]|uniref:Putative DNA-binding transcriptional regulator YafY n=1 Tax=Kribbella italica TaxID=1540520 RepID=A0A7W9MUT3_9ACTN|nr:WYL domain-containing protein [Kribbella italica]MBB5837181.1 putative DNA-binding transcriptional regulator YafY [Kribbella italica]